MNDFKDLLEGKLVFGGEEAGEPEFEGESASRAEGASAIPYSTSPDGKYRILEKIGEGGAGEVWLAEDRVIERTVALKRIKEGQPGKGLSRELLGRFLFEARITGRLDHPGIVPVHELGVASDGSLYYTMRRLDGKTLAEEIEAVRAGWPRFERRDRARAGIRFLQAFISVCNAVAFAHSRGVIHRDLKPSNIVLGKFGEAVVIDWGLAKVIAGAEPGPVREQPEKGQSAGEFLRRTFEEIEHGLSASELTTLSGVIKGTPAFMSPEQAAGFAGGLDERSDIYSLGAILFQILTFRPPVEGGTVVETLARIQAGDVTAPRVFAPEMEIPEELEGIVLKAMALHPSGRFQSAEALRLAVEAFLEGSEKRERALAEAERLYSEGAGHVARLEALGRDTAGLRDACIRAGDQVQYHDPVESKRPLWRMRDRIRAAEIESAQAFADAVVAFTSALNQVSGHGPSLKALCSLYWPRFIAAEEAGETKDIVHFRTLVERYDDGAYAERLRGDGTLSVETAAYPCRCLQDGREVRPEELAVEGYHPVSGRHFTLGNVLPGMPAIEPQTPARLRVHGPSCRSVPLEGADVWLFRYEERDRVLVPVMPRGVAVGVGCRVSSVEKIEDAKNERDLEQQGSRDPAEEHGSRERDLRGDGISSGQLLNTLHSTLNTLYDPGSPFRPVEGLYLGKTPLASFRLPMGSYLLILHKEDFEPVRLPVSIGRLESKTAFATLYPDGSFPPGFRLIPGGAFTFQGEKNNQSSGAVQVLETDDVLLATFPVDCSEYIGFLNELAARDPEGAAARAPRESDHAGLYWPFIPGQPDVASRRAGPPDSGTGGKGRGAQAVAGRYEIPTAAWIAKAAPEHKARAGRLVNATQDWEASWPVAGVSWEDALAYADWLTPPNGCLYGLPLEAEWEKAARGADGRIFPWGDHMDGTFCNMNKSRAGAMHPMPPDSYPVDESPFGVRGLAGNVATPCLDGPGRLYPHWRYFRGGSWGDAGLGLHATSRRSRTPDAVYHLVGIRLCVRLRVGGKLKGCAQEMSLGQVHRRGESR